MKEERKKTKTDRATPRRRKTKKNKKRCSERVKKSPEEEVSSSVPSACQRLESKLKRRKERTKKSSSVRTLPLPGAQWGRKKKKERQALGTSVGEEERKRWKKSEES